MFAAACGLCCDRSLSRQKQGNPKPRSPKFVPSQSGGGSASSGDDSKRNVPRNKTFMEKVLPEALVPGQRELCEDEDSDHEAEDGAAMFRQLKEIRSIAKRLEGAVQKYPRSGKGLFKKMQDRFIAVSRAEEAADDSDVERELQLWKNGNLSYWESATCRKQGQPPKGGVVLLRIAKVWVSKDDARGRSVCVKHKKGDEMQELVLCFPAKRDAEEWSYALWEFISKLRGHNMGTLHFEAKNVGMAASYAHS